MKMCAGVEWACCVCAFVRVCGEDVETRRIGELIDEGETREVADSSMQVRALKTTPKQRRVLLRYSKH